MRRLPPTSAAPVVRIDFNHDEIWAEIWKQITAATQEGFLAEVEYVEDRTAGDLDALDWARTVRPAYPSGYPHPVLFVADALTMMVEDGPLLAVDLSEDDPYRPFRCTPASVQSIENNLRVANMDFSEFADSAWTEKIFRGF